MDQKFIVAFLPDKHEDEDLSFQDWLNDRCPEGYSLCFTRHTSAIMTKMESDFFTSRDIFNEIRPAGTEFVFQRD